MRIDGVAEPAVRADPAGLVGGLRARAASAPHRTALTWLPDLGATSEPMTWAGLDDGAAAVAAALRAGGVRPGDRVLLAQPPGPGFVRGLLGCLYAECVPVPVYPAVDHRHGIRVLRTIARDCQARAAWVSDREHASTVEDLIGVPAIWHPDERRHRPDGVPDPADIAFLQYTSGSTDTPKGVMVTHANLRSNLESMRRAFGHTPASVVLSWLPMYHDMGLIGNLLHPLSLGCHVYLAPPSAFVRRPLRWLEAIGRYRAGTSGAPAFAYEMVNRAVEESGAPAVDLSHWRRAYCGAEPIPAGTLERFAELLAGTGFTADALMPCYGLAEATLLVTCTPPGDGVALRRAGAQDRPVVSCGVAYGCAVEIRDEQGGLAPDGSVGEVLVQGDSVAPGYWNRDELSARTFHAALPDRPGTWLRTGDLGYVSGGRLHITGRIKDVVIVRGRNHHPHDLERVIVEALPEIRPGGVVAFGDEAGRGVVVVAELRPPADPGAAWSAAAQALGTAFGLAIVEFVAVRPGTVPKTTSGKLRRGECRRRHLAGALGSRKPEPAPDDLLDSLAREASRLLGHAVPVHEPLVRLGLDSLTALRLAEVVHQRTGVDVPVRRLLDGASLTDLLGPSTPTAPARTAADGTLSEGQQALVFLNMLRPDDDSYVISCAWQLGPEVDRRLFEEALRAAALHQPELRTRVRIGPQDRRRVDVGPERLRATLTLTPVPVPEHRLTEQLELAAAEPFRLDTDEPLIRAYAWSAGGRITYQLVVHHLVTDLWSMSLLWRDIAAAYRSLSGGRAPSLPPIRSYDEYVAAQHDYLASSEAADRDALLRTRLPVRAAAHGVRTDRPRPVVRTGRAGRLVRVLPQEVLAGPTGTDLVALLSAVLAVTLYRFGTPSPVLFGVPVSGRSTGRGAAIAGLCTNTAPIGLTIDPDTPLGDLLAEARAQVLDAVHDGLYPLARAVRAVRPHREVGRTPLVEVTLNVHENPMPEVAGLPAALTGAAVDLDFGGLTVRTVSVPRHSCRYDLEMFVTPVDGGWETVLEYSAELFDEGTARAVLESFGAGVRAAVAAADTGRVRDLFVLSPFDREVLARGEHGGSVPTEPGALEHLRRVARESPGAPAVEEAGRTMTYGAFITAVDGLAGDLRAAGDAGPADRLVGLFVDTVTEFAIGVFGCWAAGRGFVALPGEFPDARLRAMLTEAVPELVLTSPGREVRAAGLVRGLPGPVPVEVYREPPGGAPVAPVAPPGPDDPAYAVFTSGSTGRPKGVLIRHRHLAPLLGWTRRGFDISASTRMAQTLSLAFDFGLQELFSTLPFGGCLVVPGAADRADARSYARFLRRERITALFSTPSFADQVVAAGEPMPDMRLVQLAGEVLTTATVDDMRHLVGPQCRIFNGYGPTETAVGCAVYEVPPHPVERDVPVVVPIGHAHADARLVVVDQHDLRAPVGAVGELVIGGPGVSEGYLGDPQPGVERFVHDPTGHIGGPVYRSGDLAYVRSDGQIVVTGRTDRQLKIRGYRVELGEVEHVLRGLPGVTAAVALMVESPRRLVAAVAGTGLDPASLRDGAARVLLPAAVPEQFVLLDRLPTGTSGKLDLAAVAALARQSHLPVLPDTVSGGMVEDAVRAVWARALAVEELGPSANVFDLGAHSLVVTQVHAQLEAMLGIRFPIHHVFEYPVPEDLARCLAGLLPSRQAPPSTSDAITGGNGSDAH
jgi:nonribosomal peptide synthetase protein BlmVI